MTLQPGAKDNPLRVAIIGSGPSAFYAAEHLQKKSGLNVAIDMFERLPTPFGLVRGGVAPDHQKIKSVTKLYDRIARHSNFRFYGNVEFGQDVTRADLQQHYHAVVYATGAQTDRKLGIPGEDLPGSHPATEFVGWYNGHPDYRDLDFDLSQENVAVIGNGNVAMDVARILARGTDELQETDIADHALDALAASNVKTIYLLGRRGPAQAKFSNPEIKELAELKHADVVVAPEEIALGPLSREYVLSSNDRTAERNVQILKQLAEESPQGHPRQIIPRFLVSPVEIIGEERVAAIKVVKNELYQREDGTLRPRPTDEYETIPVGLVFRSIGYHGVALSDVPFDAASGVIPNQDGRVVDAASQRQTGEYAVGWIKRGPTGIIGTNKPDAQQTMALLVEDVEAGDVLAPADPSREAMENLLATRQVRYVTYKEWQIIDRIEQERGAAVGRPRVKFSRVEDMLDALEKQALTTS